jgi:CheY-like chemotaxis protein
VLPDKVKLVTQLDVLMVTDAPDFMQVVADALAQEAIWALPIMRAHDGEEAMSLLDEGLVPHLVLLDLECPRILDVLRRLRCDSRYQDAAVVVAGSGARDMEARRTWLPGEVRLPAPFGVDDLAMAIALALSRLGDVLAADVQAPAVRGVLHAGMARKSGDERKSVVALL